MFFFAGKAICRVQTEISKKRSGKNNMSHEKEQTGKAQRHAHRHGSIPTITPLPFKERRRPGNAAGMSNKMIIHRQKFRLQAVN